MATRPWIYISNTFDSNTKTSYKKMLTIGADTLSALENEQSDPDILAMFNELDPVYSSYASIYANWETASGIRKSKTQTVETLLNEQLPIELRKWEGVVRAVYVEDSPQERAIFPNKRKPFLDGTYEQRILAITTLINALTEDGSFAALIVNVQSFYNTVSSARNLQQQKEDAVEEQSDLLENQRVLLAQTLHGILGLLIHKYRTDAVQVERFFDLSLLRSKEGESIAANAILIRGKVTMGDSTVPVVNANVSVQLLNSEDPPVFKQTNAQGRFEFFFEGLKPSDQGTVRFTCDALGFQHYETTFDIELGEIKVVDVPMAQGLQMVA